ncbi:HPr kinase/phosphorylase [Maritimibacter alkaliphilus]|uniref:HPr kinase/phosphorylase n=1 Tax=Maritimibacter alkaliphilus TaxID=404236 RepID=UPI0021BD9FAC|nr:serine kinase [Maritimibacter alkaliphilus]
MMREIAQAGDAPLILHASSVALAGRAVLVLGAAGRGKSALALELMAMGAGLVADDRTCVAARDGQVWLDAPETIRGRIEARQVGILNATPCGPAALALVVDLDRPEGERLPPQRRIKVLGSDYPLLHNSPMRHFPAAILQYLKAGRHA